MRDDGILLIGKKPTNAYVVPALMNLLNGKTISLKARGKYILRACDIALMLVERNLNNAADMSISLHTDVVKANLEENTASRADAVAATTTVNTRDIRLSAIEIKIVPSTKKSELVLPVSVKHDVKNTVLVAAQ